MKFASYLFLLPFTLCAIACSGDKYETNISIPLSEQQFEFEIYDSIVVDYLGNITLMDISPDGNTFLLLDQNTDSILISNSEGDLQYTYSHKGDGPGNYSSGRYGIGKFISNQEFLLPTTGGLYRYDLSGKFQRLYKPDFLSQPQLIIPNIENVFVDGSFIYTLLPGRGSDQFGTQGIEFQRKSKHVEVIDLKSELFSPAISFPVTSKFNSKEKAYPSLTFFPNISLGKDTLYLSFRNEPKIYSYPLSDLENLANTKTIPFTTFLQKEPKGDKVDTSFDIKDIFVGTINKIIATENHLFLVDYLSGLTDEQYAKSMENAGGDMNKIWEEASKLNESGIIFFDGKDISPAITKPVILGNISKYLSKDEVWFSLNFAEVEKDYSVIYKTRVVEKK